MDNPVASAQSTLQSLDLTKTDLKSKQDTSINQLFEFDKKLGGMLSDPNSSSFIEDPGARLSAVEGFKGTARSNINSLYDIIEQVQKHREEIQDLLDKTKKSGSGSDLIGFNEILKNTDTTPVDPPTYSPVSGVGTKVTKGNRTFEFVGNGKWQDVTPNDKYSIYGITQDQADKLRKLNEINPKLANSLLKELITKSFDPQKTTDQGAMTETEIRAGVSITDDNKTRNEKVAKYLTRGEPQTVEEFKSKVQERKDVGATRAEVLAAIAVDYANEPDKAKMAKDAVDQVFGKQGGSIFKLFGNK